MSQVKVLGDIYIIKNNIKSASVQAIRAFHKIVFEVDGDRNNRKRLRNFSGFQFKSDSLEYENKLRYISETLTIRDLIAVCNLLNLDFEGPNEDISKRIILNLSDFKLLESTDSHDSGSDSEEEEINRHASDTLNTSFHQLMSDESKAELELSKFARLAISFRDVEGTIKSFDGNECYSVEKWISDFEDIANLMYWNELQKLIFAKKSLTGIAKLFIQGESGISSWSKLKSLLKEEFGSVCNSAQLHQMLMSRRMNSRESVQEYFLIMKELSSRGKIEEEALIEYVINGILDTPSNKAILYGSKNLRDFKEKLNVYQKIKQASDSSRLQKLSTENSRAQKEPNRSIDIRCYNCGQRNHKSSVCPNRNRGLKCFNCGQYGHKSTECMCDRNMENSDTAKELGCINIIGTHSTNSMYKAIAINNFHLSALVDTGSQVTVVKENIFNKLGSCELKHNDTLLTGFGRNEVKTIGCIEVVIEIDEMKFNTTVLVVPDTAMIVDAIIGTDILSQAEVLISVYGIKFSQILPTIFLEESDIVEKGKPTFDNIISVPIRNETEKFIKRYVPNRTKKSIDVDMNIILKDKTPAFLGPRRLPFHDREIIDQELQLQFEESRNELRIQEQNQILKVQEENKKSFNLRRQRAKNYRIGDYVAIKRTQLGPGRKLNAQSFGPYKIIKVKENDTYDVKRIGNVEGPANTSTCAEFMKRWIVERELAETSNCQDDRVWDPGP